MFTKLQKKLLEICDDLCYFMACKVTVYLRMLRSLKFNVSQRVPQKPNIFALVTFLCNSFIAIVFARSFYMKTTKLQ